MSTDEGRAEGFEPEEHPTRPRAASTTSTSRWRWVAVTALVRGLARASEGEYDQAPQAPPPGDPQLPADEEVDLSSLEAPAGQPSVEVSDPGPAQPAAAPLDPPRRPLHTLRPELGPKGTVRMPMRRAVGPTGTVRMRRPLARTVLIRARPDESRAWLVVAASAVGVVLALLALRPGAGPHAPSPAPVTPTTLAASPGPVAPPLGDSPGSAADIAPASPAAEPAAAPAPPPPTSAKKGAGAGRAHTRAAAVF